MRQARTHAEEFQQFLVRNPDAGPTLDPLIATLPSTAHGWAETTGRELDLVDDAQAVLTPDLVHEVLHQLHQLRHPHPDFRWVSPPIKVHKSYSGDSRDDERVQVADLVAGVGRWAGMSALAGDHGPAALVRPFVHPPIWGDFPTFRSLTGLTSFDA